ncbi:MAG TPA: NAD-dependent epimerase/dehydratase family protein [Nitrospirales bacterium]|jgi:nucleoside-diphosphate-sugar epimerase
MKRALVTGGDGFIGGHLVRRLIEERYQVRVLGRSSSLGLPSFRSAMPSVEWVEGDVRDAAKMKEATGGADIIFHLAGRTHAVSEAAEDDAAYHAVNVDGTRNILEGAVAGGVQRVIFFSSVKVFGEETRECLDETAPARPLTGYGRSKLEAETLVLEYARATGGLGVSLRLPLVYGPGVKGNIYRMVWAIDHHLFPPFPDLPNRRSLVHVSNVVEAALLAASCAPTSSCYIVTDRLPYSTRKLYEMICRGLGKQIPHWQMPLTALSIFGRLGDLAGRIIKRRFPIDSDSLDKLVRSAWYSSQRISRELGYAPIIDFEGALPELITQYRNPRPN